MGEIPNNQKHDYLIEDLPETMSQEPMPVAAEEPPTELPAPQLDSLPEAAAEAIADKKPRLRPKSSLKQSIIQRICKVSPKDSSMEANCSAEVVYTNSQFGQMAEPCIRSACNSCTLAQPRRGLKPKSKTSAKGKSKSKTKTKSKSKRSSPVTKRKLQTGRSKRQLTPGSEQLFVAKSLLNFDPATNLSTSRGCVSRIRECLCTEVNGQIFKLMDLPTEVRDSSSSVINMRRRPQPSKPRLATKRKIGKRPCNDS